MGLGMQAFASDTLVCNIKRNSNWAFYGTDRPTAMLSLVNYRQIEREFNIVCNISDSKGNELYELAHKGSIPARDSSLLSFSFRSISPGFYNMSFSNNGKASGSMNISYEPDKILAGKDVQKGEKEDFLYFAHKVALERRDLKPQFVLLRNRDLSGRERNVYNFSMVSYGEETVTGYMAFPKGKKQLPVLVTLVPEEGRSGNVLGDFTAPEGCAELVVYLRKRGRLGERTAALLSDMLLAIDFVARREEIDNSSIFVQGTGYAGACAFVASVLDDGVAGSFVCSPDFSDFTGRYSESSVGKNVSAPVILGTGLQRDIAVLQECFSIYNNIPGDKEYFVDPSGTGIGRKEWKSVIDRVIKKLGFRQ